jgi:hypothetical protein
MMEATRLVNTLVAMTPEVTLMTAEPGPQYDAFVVRLCRDEVTGEILRAEVEYAGTGSPIQAAAVTAAWIMHQIDSCLATALDDAGASGSSASRETRESARREGEP